MTFLYSNYVIIIFRFVLSVNTTRRQIYPPIFGIFTKCGFYFGFNLTFRVIFLTMYPSGTFSAKAVAADGKSRKKHE